MEIIKGTVLLLAVLAFFTLFSYKAPKGMKAMGALASAAIAAFLVQAFQSDIGGDIFNIDFLGEVGEAVGSVDGVAAGALVALALGVSPMYAIIIGISSAGFGLLPGFLAGYLVSFLARQVETKVPNGLDLLTMLIAIPPVVRLLATFISPLVDGTLLTIGNIVTQVTDTNPIIMGIILGGLLTVVSTSPLSSMALTAILGLTGSPMAIGALAVFGSSFLNVIFFYRMNLGDLKTIISVGIEPLSQADLISANPIPIYISNFLAGATSGIFIALSGMVNGAPGTATPIPGFAIMFGFNDPMEVLMIAALCATTSAIWAFICSFIFRNYKMNRIDESTETDENSSTAV